MQVHSLHFHILIEISTTYLKYNVYHYSANYADHLNVRQIALIFKKKKKKRQLTVWLFWDFNKKLSNVARCLNSC